MNEFYDNVEEHERYLNLPPGSLRNIPIYARKPAIDAIIKVKEMAKSSLFRPGLYYIVLADLCANTAFNAKHGDRECDVRTEWFHTAAISAIGEIGLRNYVAFSKTIGDASLLVFSSFLDVVDWSNQLTKNLDALSDEYETRVLTEFKDKSKEERAVLISDFRLRARRFAHLGEVAFKEAAEPLSLAVSQTFKIEKIFSENELGCTEPVAAAIRPKLPELGLHLIENRQVEIPGYSTPTMTYYVKRPN